MKIALILVFAALSVAAQTGLPAPANGSEASPSSTNAGAVWALRFEKARVECIQSRRIICGKIIRVLPDGLVIDSGYTNLMRSPLNKSWLVPGTVAAARAANLVEANEPDAVCVGAVFLADLPKSRGKPKKPKLYDYVNLEAFPIGMYTYTSVGSVQHTVRRFTTRLSNATQWNFKQSEQQNTPPK